MKKLFIGLLIVIGAVSASAQKVKVSADPNVDVSKYKTYGWEKPMPFGNPIIMATIVDAVRSVARPSVHPSLYGSGFAAKACVTEIANAHRTVR